jgi:hypothetical protein
MILGSRIFLVLVFISKISRNFPEFRIQNSVQFGKKYWTDCQKIYLYKKFRLNYDAYSFTTASTVIFRHISLQGKPLWFHGEPPMLQVSFHGSRVRDHGSRESCHYSRVSLHWSRVPLHGSRVRLHNSIVSLYGSKVSLHNSRVSLQG